MSSFEDRFNAAAARVERAYEARATERAAYERAWAELFEHLAVVMHEGKLYANARGLGYQVDDLRIDLAERILKRLTSGKELNLRVVYGIRRATLGELAKDVAKLADPDVVGRFSARLLDLADTDAVDTVGMRAHLERVLVELEARPRQGLRVQVLRTMLETGEHTLAEIARIIDRDEGAVRGAFWYVSQYIREHHVSLAEFLELPEPVAHADAMAVSQEGRA